MKPENPVTLAETPAGDLVAVPSDNDTFDVIFETFDGKEIPLGEADDEWHSAAVNYDDEEEILTLKFDDEM